MKISSMWKAVIGGFAAGAAALGTAVQDGTVSGGDVVTIVVAIVASFGVVWRVPNR